MHRRGLELVSLMMTQCCVVALCVDIVVLMVVFMSFTMAAMKE